jgi:short-subunit dehydrogenase
MAQSKTTLITGASTGIGKATALGPRLRSTAPNQNLFTETRERTSRMPQPQSEIATYANPLGE